MTTFSVSHVLQVPHGDLLKELQRQREKEQKKKPPPYPGTANTSQQPPPGNLSGGNKPPNPTPSREQAVVPAPPSKAPSQDSLGNMSAEEVSQRLEEIERLEQELRMREPPNPVLSRINKIPWYEEQVRRETICV